MFVKHALILDHVRIKLLLYLLSLLLYYYY